MKCLVLGGRGFIGSRIVNRLLEKRYSVVVFARKRDAVAPLFPKGVTLIEGDFSSSTSLEDALKGCETCVHAITSTSPKSANDDPIFDIQSNLLPTINLLRLIPHSPVKKLVFISSSGVYGDPVYFPINETHPTNPISSYSIVKLAIERFLSMYRIQSNLDYKILRVANPFGEGQKIENHPGVIGIFLAKILQDQPITIWGDGSSIRDYLYVDDVASAAVAALEYDGPMKTFNIGSGQGQSLIDVIKAIESVTGKQATVRFEASRPFDITDSVLDIGNARKELNWEPKTPFIDGLKKMADWLSAELNMPKQGTSQLR